MRVVLNVMVLIGKDTKVEVLKISSQGMKSVFRGFRVFRRLS